MIPYYARRVLKRLFGTTHMVRDEPGGGTGHIYVLPWEPSRYTPLGWRIADSELSILGGAAGAVHITYDKPADVIDDPNWSDIRRKKAKG